MGTKDTSAQSRGNGGGEALETARRREGLRRALGEAVPTAPSPPSSSRGPTSSRYSCGRGSGARRASLGPRAATQQGRPAQPRTPRGGGGGPGGGGLLASRPAAPYHQPGDGEEVKGGQRGGRRTQEPPPPPPASNLRSLASPSRPSPVTHCPRLTSWAASEQEGGGEYEQEKQQAGEESHGATCPIPTPRPRMLSAALAVMALLFIRAPGGEGRGTYYARTLVTPPPFAEEVHQRGCDLSASCGVRVRPGESRGRLPRTLRFPRESVSRLWVGWQLAALDTRSALPVSLQLISIVNGYFI